MLHSFPTRRSSDLYPSLVSAYPSAVFEPYAVDRLDGLDLVFLALPHGESQRTMAEVRKRVGAVVDLGADFRLKDPTAYPIWYGEEHLAPDLLPDFVYGIPELAHGENALLANSPDRLANEVARALADPSMRDRLGSGARSTYERFFTPAVAGAELGTTLERIAGQGTR